MNNARVEFDKHEFNHYNILKIKSKNRTQLAKKMHFGVVFVNDKFRFHLYVDHKDNKLPGLMSFAKSRVFSFDIDPSMNKINNSESIAMFLNYLNLFQNISDEELYSHYVDFEKIHSEAYKISKFSLPKFEDIKKKITDRFVTPPEQELTDYEKKLEEVEYKLLKRNYQE